jgi:nucleoside-diphosphate-sugar epimerase
MNQKILVTGDQGYIGTYLTDFLIKLDYYVEGVDIGYFKDCNLYNLKANYNSRNVDIRSFDYKDIENFDVVIHAAALSNDPLGELDEKITYQINRDASIRLADICKKKGIKQFIYFSTQSIYGISDTKEELDEYKSIKNPITAYAISKWQAEQYITKLGDDNFHVNALRPSTVFGPSARLRSDIIFNNFMANAFTTNMIEIKSDGTPSRPILHIQDLCMSVLAILKNRSKKNNNQSYNLGKKDGNYTVKEIADSVKNQYPNSNIFYSGDHGKDSRSYRVSFNKFHNEFPNIYHSKYSLDYGTQELDLFFKKILFNKEDLFGVKTNRLNKLKYLLKEDYLNDKLEWKKN